MSPYGVTAVAILCLMGAVVLVIDYFVKKKRKKS